MGIHNVPERHPCHRDSLPVEARPFLNPFPYLCSECRYPITFSHTDEGKRGYFHVFPVNIPTARLQSIESTHTTMWDIVERHRSFRRPW